MTYKIYDETQGKYLEYIDGVVRDFISRDDADYTAYTYAQETGHVYRVEPCD